MLMALALLLGVRTALADAANHYLITYDSDNQTAGVPFTITVTAVDASDNVDTGYVGTIHFTSSDNNAILPNDYTFQVSDNGTHTFTIEFRTSGSQTVTVTDNASLTSYKTWSVSAATAHHIMVSPDSSTITAGATETYTAEAFDEFNNSLGYVTSSTTFSITPAAGGSWSGTYNNVYTSAKAGTWIVTGTCGALSDNASLTINAAEAHHIVISPDTTSITAGDTQAYTAQSFDQFNNLIADVTSSTTFSITPAAGGSWSGTYNNVYTSAKAGTWTVTGTYSALSDDASLTINPAAAHHIVISPDTTSITAGATQAYTAEAFDQFNNSLGFVTENTTFSIAGDHGGSWSANTYTSAKAGTWTVTGTYSTLSDDASLTVNAAGAHHIVISPDTATITAGGTQAYTAEAFDEFNNSLGFVTENTTFSIAGEHGGSWSANTYTSAKAGTWFVTGTCGTLSDNASLTVNPAAAHHIVISPDTTSITAGDTQAYTAEAFDEFNNSLGFVTENTTFSIAGDHGGSWSANTYTSAKAGTWTVTGTYGALSDNASLTINAGSARHIVISPDTATITAGGTQAYTAEAFDQFNNTLGFVTENTTFSITGDHGGSWSANTYTSAKAGAWTVTGTYGTHTATVTLNVNPGAIAHYDVTSSSYDQKVGVPFNVTVTAHDQYHNVVNDSVTKVALTTGPTIEQQSTIYFDTNGDGSFQERSMTLKNGTFTVSARCNKAAANVVIYATSGDNENKKSGSSQPYTFTTAVVNKPPVATTDTHKVDLDGTLNVTAPGVLGNDTDEAGGTLTAVLVTSVSHGTLTLNPDGSFSYTPEPGFTGTDSFTYKVSDGTSDSNVATVSITVNGASPAHGSGIPPGVWIGSILAAFLLGGVVYLYWRRSINSTPQAELDSVAALKVKMARMEERLAEQRLKEAQTGENDGENEGSKRHGSRWQRLREWINRLRRGR